MTRRVLLVDDDADLLALLRVAFDLSGGWETLLADSATEAARHLREASVDVVVTDGDLGDGSGQDLLSVAGAIPVVLLSGAVDAPPDTLQPHPSFAAAVAKPFNPMTLPGLIAHVVDEATP